MYSSILSNSIHNPNDNGTTGEAGILAWGDNTKYYMINGNNITRTASKVGYLIYEATHGTHGTPSKNVYSNNAGFRMSTGNYNITASSTNSNNLVYP